MNNKNYPAFENYNPRQAALAARGKTCVLDEGHIRRGYQALPDELAGLGAACRMA